eukprot:g5041.t1
MMQLSFVMMLLLTTAATALDIFVAAPDSVEAINGADGSPMRPFATVEHARDALRSGAVGSGERVRVLLRGTHALPRPLVLDARDARDAASAVTYATAPGEAEPAQLLGGVVLPASAFTPAPGLDGVFRANLFEHGVNASELGALASPYPSSKLELFYGGRPMHLARDPNIGTDALATWRWAGYENATGASVTAEGSTVIDFADAARAERWRAAAAGAGADLWLHGYFKFDWRDTFVRVSAIAPKPSNRHTNASGASYTLALDASTPPQYPAVKGCRFYALNALALLDADEEYFVDSAAGALYFRPPGGALDPAAQVVVSVLETVVSMASANHTSLANLTLSTARGDVLSVAGAQGFSASNLTVSNAGAACVTLEGASSGIDASTVFGCGRAGVHLAGGDVKTLARGNLSVTRTRVANFSRLQRTYTPGVSFSGVGLYVAHNIIEHAPHCAIQGGGNDNLFEHNAISHASFECTDTGAFYVGRSWAQRGNVARYNSFDTVRPTERLAQASCSQNAFYLDDEMSGWQFYGNSIRNCTTGVLLGGGRRNVIRNNTFKANDKDIAFDDRGMNWQHASCLQNCSASLGTSCFRATLDSLNYTQPPYATRYPELKGIYSDHPCLPVYNVIADNRFCHTRSPKGGQFIDRDAETVKSWLSTLSNNTEDCP